MELGEFDLRILYRPGELHYLPDLLSRHQIDELSAAELAEKMSELIANRYDTMLAQAQANADGSLVFDPEKIEKCSVSPNSGSE